MSNLSEIKYKKGDIVRVWSLQSFFHGGFLKGERAVVRQDQIGDSVILMVVRNFNGVYKVDESYEVYAKQCEPYRNDDSNSSYDDACLELDIYIKKLQK